MSKYHSYNAINSTAINSSNSLTSAILFILLMNKNHKNNMLFFITDSQIIRNKIQCEWTLENVDVRQQTNGIDCGLFITKFAIDIKNQAEDFKSAFNQVKFRYKLKEMLKKHIQR